MTRQRLVGLSAALAILGIVAGLPALLLAIGASPVPPAMPPEYTPGELIDQEKIQTTPLPRNPGWEETATAGTI